MYLPGSWKYTTVFSTCLCKRAWQIHCYSDFTAVESSTYSGHTGAMVVISSKIWYIYKSIKYHQLQKLKVHNPSRTRGIKRHIICILNNFGNVLFRCLLGQVDSWFLFNSNYWSVWGGGSRRIPVCVKSWVDLHYQHGHDYSKTLASGLWENVKPFTRVDSEKWQSFPSWSMCRY